MLHSLAVIAADDDNSGGAGSFLPLVFIALIFVAMYFLMIRPQRRRLREQQDMQRAISEGDEVLTTSGVYGFIVAMEDDVVWLEIAEDVEIRIAKGAISKVVQQGDAPSTDAAGPTDTTTDDDANAADS
jgi:preprotein translocase subunit YajC